MKYWSNDKILFEFNFIVKITRNLWKAYAPFWLKKQLTFNEICKVVVDVSRFLMMWETIISYWLTLVEVVEIPCAVVVFAI